jgi:DNA-binding GntR family transcriptional regulator
MVQHKSLADKAYDLIKAEIVTCALEPGRQIAQPQLVERYGVSMTPIREALQRLAQEGFLQPIPRFGYIVSPITLSDVREIYELRFIVEAAAARLAAVKASQEDLQRISQAADFSYIYGDPRSIPDFLARNAAFHRSIAVVAGNQRLVGIVSRLLDEMARIFYLGLDVQDMTEEVRREHAAIARALCDRDPDRAEQIVTAQIERSQERVLEALSSADNRGVSGSLAQSVQVRSPAGQLFHIGTGGQASM